MAVYLHEEDLPATVLADGPSAIDTETMGLHPGRDRLCLVQISDGGGDEQQANVDEAKGHASGHGRRLCFTSLSKSSRRRSTPCSARGS